MEFAMNWLRTACAVATPAEADRYEKELEALELGSGSERERLDALEYKYILPPEECARIIRARFEGDVSLPDAMPILRVNWVDAEQLRSLEARQDYASDADFTWNAFDALLVHYHFWERLGPQLDPTSGWHGPQLDLGRSDTLDRLNLVNGGADVDYEAAFPEAQDMFDVLRRHLFQKEGVMGPERPSSLSVAALLTGLVLTEFQRALPRSDRIPFADICGHLLDTRTPNTARIALYRRLDQMVQPTWETSPPSGPLCQLLADLDREVSARSARKEQLTGIDVILTLHGGDCYGAARAGRDLLGHVARDAIMLACGGRTPLASKTLGLAQTWVPTEAEEMLAVAMSPHLDDLFARMPYAEDRTLELPPVSPMRILPPDTRSNDTPSNVQNALKVLDRYRWVLGRLDPLRVALVSTPPHAKRAEKAFRDAASPGIASFTTYTIRAAQLHFTGRNVLPAGILNNFTEAGKELYMTCVL